MNACRWSASAGALSGHLPTRPGPIRVEWKRPGFAILPRWFLPHSVLPQRKYRVSDFTTYHNPRGSKARISSRAVIGRPLEKVLELLG